MNGKWKFFPFFYKEMDEVALINMYIATVRDSFFAQQRLQK